jgi:hypothetical protein
MGKQRLAQARFLLRITCFAFGWTRAAKKKFLNFASPQRKWRFWFSRFIYAKKSLIFTH